MTAQANAVPGRSGTDLGRAAQNPRQASVSDFVVWLDQIGETDGLSRRRLVALFFEFCEVEGLEALSEARLLRRARAGGLERYRLSRGTRAWRYRRRCAEVAALERQTVA